MLVLTRRVGERIVIGEGIEVTVVSVRGDQVRLGIVAPREVSIHRAEVAEAVRRENEAAARAAEVVGRANEQQEAIGRRTNEGQEAVGRSAEERRETVGQRAQAVRSGCR